MKRLLILSNGAGEDAIAARILQEFPPEIRERVVCFPMVGPGRALAESYPLWGPRVAPPSEGLFRESWRLAVADLVGGVIGGHLRQLGALRRHRGEVSLAVAVGDLFPVLWSYLAGFETVFVGTAKSVFHHPYSFFERALLRRMARLSLVRDGPTAEALEAGGVNAEWLGNAMMDEVEPRGVELALPEEATVVTLLPGSRAQAPEVLPQQLQALSLLAPRYRGLLGAVVLAPGSEPGELCSEAVGQGWALKSRPEAPPHELGLLERDGVTVYLYNGVLGDVLARSQAALGQAGTANEQAAGAGVPVVAYDHRQVQSLRWYRARQRGLLGDAVTIVAPGPENLAAELERLLADPIERARRADIGRRRMGPSGGSSRMAQRIEELWRQR